MISPASFHLQFAGLKMRKWHGLISLQNTLQAIGAATHLISLLHLLFILKLAPATPTEHN